MYHFRNLLILCTGLLLCNACTSRQEKELLQKAIEIVDHNPRKALLLLDSISSPKSMGKYDYMRYIVILTQARSLDYQDITDNDRILDAQDYFTRKNDPEMATRASYYAASYWNEKGEVDKQLKYELMANQYARQAGNDLFQVKSAHWIGSIYYNKEVLDSALVYYHRAEQLCNTEGYSEKDRLDLLYMIGRTYNELGQVEKASVYFDNGLIQAQKLHNCLYEANFLQHKGVIFRDKGDYAQARECLDRALSKRPASIDSLRIYLGYAKLYRLSGQRDSNKYYVDLVKNRIDELTWGPNREWAFKEFQLEFERRLNRNPLLKAAYNNKRSY